MTYTRAMNRPAGEAPPDRASRLLSRLVPHALAIAVGSVAGMGTLLLGVAGSVPAGAELGSGLLLEALAAGAVGLLGGALVAWIRNAVVAVYLRYAWSRLQHHQANDILDRVS